MRSARRAPRHCGSSSTMPTTRDVLALPFGGQRIGKPHLRPCGRVAEAERAGGAEGETRGKCHSECCGEAARRRSYLPQPASPTESRSSSSRRRRSRARDRRRRRPRPGTAIAAHRRQTRATAAGQAMAARARSESERATALWERERHGYLQADGQARSIRRMADGRLPGDAGSRYYRRELGHTYAAATVEPNPRIGATNSPGRISMRRPLLLLVLLMRLGISGAFAQPKTKVPRAPAEEPDRQGSFDRRQRVHARRRQERSPRRDAHLAGIPGLQRRRACALLAVMKALEPQYHQDDEVAYTWGTKGKITKCSIYLESWEAEATGGTGAVVGCEANGVSTSPCCRRPIRKSRRPPTLAPQGRARGSQEAVRARPAQNIPKG